MTIHYDRRELSQSDFMPSQPVRSRPQASTPTAEQLQGKGHCTMSATVTKSQISTVALFPQLSFGDILAHYVCTELEQTGRCQTTVLQKLPTGKSFQLQSWNPHSKGPRIYSRVSQLAV